jgi:MFS family permease
MLLATAGIVLFALLHVHPWEISVGMVFIGIGVPFAYAAMAKLIIDAVRPTETGIATGMNTVLRTVGGVIGGQVGAALLTSDTIGKTNVPAESAFVIAFWISAGVALLGAGFALWTNERPTRAAFAD